MMKRKIILSAAAAVLAALMLAGCGAGQTGESASQSEAVESNSDGAEENGGDSAAESGSDGAAESSGDGAVENGDDGAAESGSGSDGAEVSPEDAALIRIGGLKGPTSMGLVRMMDRAEKGETDNTYEFTMAGAADELVGKIATGDLDIALIPANVASVLYTKTKGQVAVADINTLGVLYVVASDDSISSMGDLKGRTLYMTGKGTTPEYAVHYLLAENGLSASDVDLQFKSEATEVASILKEDPAAIGVLPQPFATAACIQNPDLKQVIDLTAEWDKLNQSTGSMLVTGVTLVRREFLQEHENAVKLFLEDHQESTAYTSSNADEAANLIAGAGIVEKAPIAKQALPYCNIVCITGQEMKDALSGYLQVLFDQDAASVGGQLPGEDFYYIP